MKKLGYLFIIAGISLLAIFGYDYIKMKKNEQQSLVEARDRLNQKDYSRSEIDLGDSFGLLKVPKLERTLPIIEGADAEALDKGVGHLAETKLPGEDEQIVLSGHRDTVFREFSKLEIGDEFIVEMDDGTYSYEIKDTEIVSADDTSVVRPMGEEVLVVSTCYPFHYLGSAPDRFVFYAYPTN